MRLPTTTLLPLLLSPVVDRRASPRLSASIDGLSIREAAGLDLAPAELLAEAFGGQALFHLSSLKAPGLAANVFFKPIGGPVVAVASVDDGDCAGVAQLLRVKLTAVAVGSEGGARAARPVAFIQNVAVAPRARRRGVGRALMAWCEDVATRWPGDDAVDEAWLAVGVDNGAAISLYESLGYERLGVQMGNVLLRKPLLAAPTEAADGSAGAATAPPPSSRAPRDAATAAAAAARSSGGGWSGKRGKKKKKKKGKKGRKR